MPNKLGTIGKFGVVVGFIAFGIALFLFFYGPIHRNESSFFASARTSIQALLTKEDGATHSSKRSRINIDNALSYTSVLFAFLAILAGTVAYIIDTKKELAYASLSVGAATLFFHFILIAFGVLIILAVIVYILNN